MFGKSVDKECRDLVLFVSESAHRNRMEETGKKTLVSARSKKTGLLFDS